MCSIVLDPSGYMNGYWRQAYAGLVIWDGGFRAIRVWHNLICDPVTVVACKTGYDMNRWIKIVLNWLIGVDLENSDTALLRIPNRWIFLMWWGHLCVMVCSRQGWLLVSNTKVRGTVIRSSPPSRSPDEWPGLPLQWSSHRNLPRFVILTAAVKRGQSLRWQKRTICGMSIEWTCRIDDLSVQMTEDQRPAPCTLGVQRLRRVTAWFISRFLVTVFSFYFYKPRVGSLWHVP